MINLAIEESVAQRRIDATRKGYAAGFSYTPLRGKVPQTKGWQSAPRETLEQTLSWAEQGNVGLRTGGASGGLVVVDIDVYAGGRVPDGLPETVTVRTGRDGLHLYFRLPAGVCMGNSAGKLAEHVDVRGQSGQVVAVGSIHPDTGKCYEYAPGLALEEVDIAELPQWVIDQLCQPKQEQLQPIGRDGTAYPDLVRQQQGHGCNRYLGNALRGEADSVTCAAVGQRNATLNESSFKLGGLEHAGLRRDVAENALVGAAMANGLSEHEARATFASGWTSGAAKPRTVESWTRGTAIARGASHGDAEQALPRIENFLLVEVEGQKRPVVQAKSLPVLAGEVLGQTGGWPKRCGNLVFAVDDNEVRWLTTPAELAAWLGTIAHVDFRRGPDLITMEVLFAHFRATAEAFDSVETLPHEPTIPRAFYLWEPPNGYVPTGEYLDKLCSFFENTETPEDAVLLRAMFCTPAWGGMPGTRPAFCIMSADRGAGKSTVSDAVALLYGGAVEVEPTGNQDRLVQRLLAPAALTRRIVRLDNAKGLVGGPLLEAQITAREISGHRLHVGESTRINTLTWIVTGNSPQLSRDMAERAFILRLSKPQPTPGWREQVFAFIEEHSDGVLADIVQVLRGPALSTAGDRWQGWIDGVLSRLTADVAGVVCLNQSRRDAHDEECEEAALIMDILIGKETNRNCGDDRTVIDAGRARYFISSKLLRREMEEAMGMKMTTSAVASKMRSHIESGRLPSVRKYRANSHAPRGYEFTIPNRWEDTSSQGG